MNALRRCGFLLCSLLFVASCGDDVVRDTVDASADVGADATHDADAATDPTDASDDGDASADADAATTPGPLFTGGCPQPGLVQARLIDDGTRMEGPSALGGEGDWLLMNEHAAFIVTGMEQRRTYWYYAGIPVDAVALDGCQQAGPEQFDETAFIIGRADLAAVEQSILRGFRAERFDLISDGSDGGEARLRVTGVDDWFWLIELELLSEAVANGSPRPLTSEQGVEITVDYVLEPDASSLRVEVRVRNLLDEPQRLITGLTHFFADGTRTIYAARDRLSFAGFGADLALPWLVASSGTGAWGWAAEGWTTATTNITGVDAMIDGATFLNPPRLGPAGSDDDTSLSVFHFAVGASDHHSAIAELFRVVDEPLLGVPASASALSGQVVDSATDVPIAGATVDVEAARADGGWGVIDSFVTDADGRFAGEVAAFAGVEAWRLTVASAGRPSPDPVVVDLTSPPEDVTIEMGAAGTIVWSVVDGAGDPIPAKLALWRGDAMVHRLFGAPGGGRWDVPPGTWEIDVTRGLEYAPFSGEIEVSSGQDVVLDVVLERVVDTSGYLSMDGHVHSGPSPDSPVDVPTRLRTLAVEGVEVAVSSDHEAILPWEPWLEASGVDGHVRSVLGSEVTPPIPEHINAWPFPATPDVAPRGDFVQWYGMDLEEIFAAIRARGAQVISLNHPRLGCNWLCLIGYDRITGEPTVDDPTIFGFEPDAELWSWDFDAVEYQNDPSPVLVDPARPDATGLFEDWMSFQNHGRRITALGVTDVHGFDAQGVPRNWFEAPTDDPTAFEDGMLVDAILGGRSLVSTGAFARVAIGDATMGDTVTVDGDVTLSLRVEALEEIDVTHVTVFANCDEVMTVATDDPYAVVKLDTELSFALESDAHVVVLGWGADLLPRNLPQFDPAGVPRFTTNPIFVDADQDGVFTPPGGRSCTYEIAHPKGVAAPRHVGRLADLDGWLHRRAAVIDDLRPGRWPRCSEEAH